MEMGNYYLYLVGRQQAYLAANSSRILEVMMKYLLAMYIPIWNFELGKWKSKIGYFGIAIDK